MESGDKKGVHGDSGGVVTASDISLRGLCGNWSSSSSSHGRLMNSASSYLIISVWSGCKLHTHTLLTSSSREFANINGDDTC
jgi:hypothetical protein